VEVAEIVEVAEVTLVEGGAQPNGFSSSSAVMILENGTRARADLADPVPRRSGGGEQFGICERRFSVSNRPSELSSTAPKNWPIVDGGTLEQDEVRGLDAAGEEEEHATGVIAVEDVEVGDGVADVVVVVAQAGAVAARTGVHTLVRSMKQALAGSEALTL